MKYIIIATIVTSLTVFALMQVHKQDVKRNVIADCIHTQSQVQGFKGTAQEEWRTFASYCKEVAN